jgi:hypothetical protein
MTPYKSLFQESRYTRLAQTDEQEDAIYKIVKWLKKLGKVVVGATTIGKSPQTVLLDLTHQGGEIRVRASDDGRYPFIQVNNKEVNDFQDLKDALGMSDSKVEDEDLEEDFRSQ